MPVIQQIKKRCQFMTISNHPVVCNLKAARKEKGLSQSELAEMVGIKRQAIYDIESGRYVPNTQIALLLSRVLGCKVEDLFSIDFGTCSKSVILAEDAGTGAPRVSLVKVRGELIAYPLDDKWMTGEGFQSADGLIQEGNCVRLFHGEEILDKKALILGCDPAFAILSSHVSRAGGEARLQCRFASSVGALEGLSRGLAHLAGTHLHNTSDVESNLELARSTLRGMRAKVVAFTSFEEGFMVSPGNPYGIRSVGDLATGTIRFVNREQGAALRMLLDDHLKGQGINPVSIDGYERLAASHNEGARLVSFGLADAALGLRAVALEHGLGFVPIASARCDLVIPHDLLDHPAVKIIMDSLQTRNLREELYALPGYDPSSMGMLIGEVYSAADESV